MQIIWYFSGYTLHTLLDLLSLYRCSPPLAVTPKRTSGGLRAPACCSTWWRPAGRGATGPREGSRQPCVVMNFWIISLGIFQWWFACHGMQPAKWEEGALLPICFLYLSVWSHRPSICWRGDDWNGLTDLWAIPERLGPLRYWRERRDAPYCPGAAMGWVSTRLLHGCTVSM